MNKLGCWSDLWFEFGLPGVQSFVGFGDLRGLFGVRFFNLPSFVYDFRKLKIKSTHLNRGTTART